MLTPLILLSALTVPVAIFLTYQIGRSEPALVALSLATPVLLIAVITESGDGILMNVAVALYGFASVGVICYWFAVRRKRKE